VNRHGRGKVKGWKDDVGSEIIYNRRKRFSRTGTAVENWKSIFE
jgi:hypothetical protein